jgi:2,3-bisphosphoglycerate-independent phosphoglycerate mutase
VDNERKNVTLKDGGALEDVAPTLLELFGIKQPKEMTGHSLIKG